MGFQTCVSIIWQTQRLSEEQASDSTSAPEMMAQLLYLSWPVTCNLKSKELLFMFRIFLQLLYQTLTILWNLENTVDDLAFEHSIHTGKRYKHI